MAIIKKYAAFQNLSNKQTFLVDDEPFSQYLKITELNDTLTGGKNGFLIQGSPHLRETTEIKIEVLDVNGDTVYYEPGYGIPEYYEGVSSIVAMHVYDDTPIGTGKITILAELKTYEDDLGVTRDVPDEWKGVYNLKWEREFKINNRLANEDKVRFYRRPKVNIEEIVKPIFNVTVPTINQTGSLVGIPEIPGAGTNLDTWTAGTNYKLQIDDTTSFDESADEKTIIIPSLNYEPRIIDVLTSKTVLVNEPYTDNNNIVRSFDSTPYELSYDDIGNATTVDTALTGSFAKIKLTDLKTFVGDVARVKVFRKSRNEVTDFLFTQESKLESTELLRDIDTKSANEISYGFFTESTLENYWTTSSADHPVSIDVATLLNSAHIDYDEGAGGVQKLIANETVNISSGVEYTLSFKTVMNGIRDANKKLKVYLQSVDNRIDLVEISGDGNYQLPTAVTNNVIADATDTMNLVVEVNGSDWLISSISLRNAEETSFSPDEFLLIQDVPRKLEAETFDFRFEFYDINNNYIPVDVTASHTFTGGNLSNAGSTSRFMTFTASSNSFRFATGSVGNPPEQKIFFTVTQNLLSGSTSYYSAAYDDTGTYLTSESYAGGQYPGLFTNATDDGATLDIANFTGSREDITVSTIIYTASIDDKVAYSTVARFVDGANVALLFTTANKNQFFYRLTDLSPQPSSQQIRLTATRYNLGVPIPDVTVTSGSGKPALTVLSETGDVITYGINASSYPYSTGETTYTFSAIDNFGTEHTDEETITPVVKQDGISVELSNEVTTFPANSKGEVTSYTTGNGYVNFSVGNEDIVHSNGLLVPNTFDITSVTGSNCTPLSATPSSNQYGISAMSADEATLELAIKYRAGDSSILEFRRFVKYSKSRNGKPNVIVSAFPSSQAITADESGSQVGSFENITVTAVEGTTDRFNYVQITGNTGFSVVPSNPPVSIKTIDMSTATMQDSAKTGTLSLKVYYTDSEGTPGNRTIKYSTTKVNKGDTGTPGTDGQDGQDGQDGADAKLLNLFTPYTLITYDENGENPTPSGSFFVTASVQNVTDPLFKFYGDGVSDDGSFLSPTTKEYTIPSTYTSFGAPNTIHVEASESGSQTGILSDSVTIFKIKEGTTGPGIVFTGEYDSTREYQFSLENGRRDAILTEGEHYWAAKQQVPAGTPAPVFGVSNSYWEYLGTEDFFVAAKIAIFDESYVRNTLNIGTTTSGSISSANITLHGGTNYPYFSLGQANDLIDQDYMAPGIWLGMDEADGEPKFSLVGSSGNYLSWNGTSLSVSGSIYTTDGNISGWIINPTTLESESGSIILDPITPKIEVGDYVEINPSLDLNTGFTNEMSTGAPVDLSIGEYFVLPSYSSTLITGGIFDGYYLWEITDTISRDTGVITETVDVVAGESITIANIDARSIQVTFTGETITSASGLRKTRMLNMGLLEFSYFVELNGVRHTIYTTSSPRQQVDSSQATVTFTIPNLSGLSFTSNVTNSAASIKFGWEIPADSIYGVVDQDGNIVTASVYVNECNVSSLNKISVPKQTTINSGGMIVALSANNYFMISGSTNGGSYMESVGTWVHNGSVIGGSGVASGGTTGTTYVHPDHTGDVVSSGDGETTYSGSMPVALGGTGNAYTSFATTATTESIYNLPGSDADIVTVPYETTLSDGDILYGVTSADSMSVLTTTGTAEGDLMTLENGFPTWSLNTGTKSELWQLDSDNFGPILKHDDVNTRLIIRNSADTGYYDLMARVVYAKNNLIVSGSSLISGSITVGGNATFTGDQVNLQSEDVNIDANYIRLNNEYTGTTPTENGGLWVGRGVLADASLLWDETDNLWKAGLIGGEKEILLEGALYSKIDFTGSGFASSSTQIDHDQTTNFVANEHIDHTNVSILGGNGLVGGGTINTNQTLNVASANNGIIVNTDNIELNTSSTTFTSGVKSKLDAENVFSSSVQIDHNLTTNFVSNEHIDHSTVSILGGNGLTGGGSIDTNQTLNVSSSNDGIIVNADSIELDATSTTFTSGVKDKLNIENVFSSSDQVDANFISGFDEEVKEKLDSENIVSGSIQIEHVFTSGYEINEHIDWTIDQGSTNIEPSNITGLTAGIQLTGTKADFDSALTDGDFLYVGDVTTNQPTTLGYVDSTGTITSDGNDITIGMFSTTTSGYGFVVGSNDLDNTHFLRADGAWAVVPVPNEPAIYVSSGLPVLTTGITAEEVRNLIGAGTSSTTGTVTSVGTSAPLSGGPITDSGTISISQATSTTDGYLSSIDWNTFNNKTDNTGTVTEVNGTGTVNGITLTGTVNTSGDLTLGGTLSGITISQLDPSSVITSAETFVDSDSYLLTAAAIEDKIISYGYVTTDTQLSNEEVQDIVGGMINITGAQSGMGITYNDANGTIDFDLSHVHPYDNYSGWDIYINGSYYERISSGENVNFTGSGATSVSYNGSTLTISSTDTNSWRPIDNIPVNGATTTSISSNWAYDHENNASAHGTFDNYGGWNLYTNGTNRGLITSGEIFEIDDGTGISLSYSATNNQVTLSHSDTSTLSGTYGSTADGTKIDTITVDALGHVTAIATGAVGGGTVDGSGSANTLAIWSDSNTLTYNSGITVVNTDEISAGDFNLSSDKNLKENIRPLTGVEWTDKIELKSFNFKSDSTKTEKFGVIAQDVEKYAPNLINEKEDGTKTVKYIGFLIAKMARMEEKIKELEQKLENK